MNRGESCRTTTMASVYHSNIGSPHHSLLQYLLLHMLFQASLRTSQQSLSLGACRDMHNARYSATLLDKIAQITTQLPIIDYANTPKSVIPTLLSILPPADTFHHRRTVSGRHEMFPANVLYKQKACDATSNLILRPASSSPNFETEAAAQ